MKGVPEVASRKWAKSTSRVSSSATEQASAARTSLPYTHIAIIYNPISTGDAPGKAKRLHARLKRRLGEVPVSLHQTEYAGHAEGLAYELAALSKQPLIISVSGDGGYHEVINGALRAAQEHGTKPICAVHDAGNANDHRRTVKENPLTKAIIEGKVQKLDLLKLEAAATLRQPSTTRFAHSYIGLGITPAVAVELNRRQLNRWRETLLVAKTFLYFKPFTILVDGKRRQFDSLVFANIRQMAKVLTLSKGGRPDDGAFEIIEIPHKSRVAVLLTAAKAALFNLGEQPRRTKYEFTAIEPLTLQLDGEVLKLKKGTHAAVRIAPKALRTIL